MSGRLDGKVCVIVGAGQQPGRTIGNGRASNVPMGRQGTAWHVANAAVFPAGDEAAFVSGACLPVDGAQSARRG